jgi:hypothetical protein
VCSELTESGVRAGKEEVEGPAAKSVRYRWRVAEVTAAVVARGYTAVQSAPVILWTKDALLAFDEDSAADVQVRALLGCEAGRLASPPPLLERVSDV